jgi:hypothetical protein
MNRDLTNAIRSAFRSPRELCAKLGIDRGAKPQPRDGLFVSCPWHAERSPSCSVFLGPDGTVAVKCWGCDVAGDALTLIAGARALSLRSQFKLVLETACELGGLWRELDELRGGRPAEPRPEPVARAPVELPPERVYPDAGELKALWTAGHRVTDDGQARAELEQRGLDPLSVANTDLVRVIPADRWLPRWARFQGATWNTTGHRIMVLTYDAEGAAKSVRAWRVSPSDTPKRLPPAGHRAGELVVANRYAVALLRGHAVRNPVVICEGEPDWLVRSMVTPGLAVIGIGSGSWHEGFAARIQYGGEVVVRTHRDQAGDRYAERVVETLKNRAQVRRWIIEEETEAA